MLTFVVSGLALHLLLQNLEGTNFLRIFAAKKWKEDETNEVV